MRVTVYVYDHIKDELGRGNVSLELPAGSTIGDMLGRLVTEVHPLFGQLGDDDSTLYGVNLLVLDGERLTLPRDADRPLSDGAEVHLIPPIAGGWELGRWGDGERCSPDLPICLSPQRPIRAIAPRALAWRAAG